MLGYVLKKYGVQVTPIILGVILGPMIDPNYRRAMIGAREDVGQFPLDFVTHPISCILSLALVLMLLARTPAWRWLRSRLGRADAPTDAAGDPGPHAEPVPKGAPRSARCRQGRPCGRRRQRGRPGTPFGFDRDAAQAEGDALAARAISPDPAEQAAAHAEILALGMEPVDLMAEAYRTFENTVVRHDRRLPGPGSRSRRVKADLDALQTARPIEETMIAG